MSTVDRVRAATEAAAATVREIRHLTLPDDPAPARRHRFRSPRPGPAWGNWLVPLTSAMAVIAVAATLVAVRGLSSTGSRSTPATTSASDGGVPRYYVELSYLSAGPKGGEVHDAYLVDTSTGEHLATFTPPSDAAFNYVAASPDDTTFVLGASAGPGYGPSGSAGKTGPGWPVTSLWYVLRLTPGAAGQARLTPVPVASSFAGTSVQGVAVSPDGRTLAVASQAVRASLRMTTSPLTLRTYSLATGQLLRTWTDPAGPLAGLRGLTWLDDGRTLAFAYPDPSTPGQIGTLSAPESVRTLDTASPGANLVADSRPVFSVPAGGACSTLLMTADGKSVICGSSALASPTPAPGGNSVPACGKGGLELTAYSVATGKPERVLYRYPGACGGGTVWVLWAGSATLAIAEIVYSTGPDTQFMTTVGVVPPGRPANLPANLGETFGGGAGGTVAF